MLNRIPKLFIVCAVVYLVTSLWVGLDPRRYFNLFAAETTGLVIRSEVIVATRPDGKRTIKVPVWHFAARYYVSGKTFVTNEFSPDKEYWRDEANLMQSIRPVDSQVTVRYITSRPDKAWIMQANPPYGHFVKSFVYIAFALAFYMFLSISDKRR